MKRRSFLAGGSALISGSLFGQTGMSTMSPHLIVPPEDAQHEFTFMQWPVNKRVYPDREFLDLLQHTIADIANTISEFETVIMLAAQSNHASARKLLSQAVELWDVPTDDLWCRDSGPLFGVVDKEKLVISHIQFNGWGEKQVHNRDGKVAVRVANKLGVPVISSGLKGEVGGVEHDGYGLLMAHESSWINDNRNPGISREEIESRLLNTYGANRVIWSRGVWGQDITDYHIDSLARFTGARRVLINLPDRPDLQDPFHVAATETHDTLARAGVSIDVIPEPTKRRIDNINFVASYANYYVCNGGVIAAQFGDPNTDNIAVEALRRHFPDRDVVTLNVDALGEIGGGIHCATQQMPAL